MSYIKHLNRGFLRIFVSFYLTSIKNFKHSYVREEGERLSRVFRHHFWNIGKLFEFVRGFCGAETASKPFRFTPSSALGPCARLLRLEFENVFRLFVETQTLKGTFGQKIGFQRTFSLKSQLSIIGTKDMTADTSSVLPRLLAGVFFVKSCHNNSWG